MIKKVLILVSDFYQEIYKILLDGTISVLKENSISYEQVVVPGVFELASSINMGLETYEYNGVIVLGCIVKNKSFQMKIAIEGRLRAIRDSCIYYSAPLGVGLLVVDSKNKALNLAEKYAKNAANFCLQMMKIKEQFITYNDKIPSTFN